MAGKRRSLDELLRLKGVGRFQAMALLQAARYYVLRGDEEMAKSFGLNRAIFYAWAKHYGPRGRGWASASTRRLEHAGKRGSEREERGRCPEGMEEVLGECVARGRRGYYEIGGREQTPWDYEREVNARLRGLIDPRKAWRAAVEYVSGFPRWVLEDPRLFYRYVYEPVRDTFFKTLLEGKKPRPPPRIGERIEALERLAKHAKREAKDTIAEGEGAAEGEEQEGR